MAFKRSALKNWIVTRTVTLFGDNTVEIDVRVMSKADGEAVIAKGSDVETVKGLVSAMRGYQDEKGKELGFEGFVADLESGVLPPAAAGGVASEAINAQFDAAIKN